MQKLNLLIILIITIFHPECHSQCLDWVESTRGSGNESGISITTDQNGNVYTTGYFDESFDADPSPAILNLVNNGGRDFYISKYDTYGQIMWAVSIGGSEDDVANTIKLDEFGNVYIAGGFKGTVDFNPGLGIHELVSNGNLDAFILKLDTDGNFVWGISFGHVNNDFVEDIVIKNGYIFVAGLFKGTVDFNPSSGMAYITSSGLNYNAYLQRLTTAGNFLWVRHFDGNNSIYLSQMIMDHEDNLLITGLFSGSHDFDYTNNDFILTSTSYYDGYVVKVNTLGQLIWAKSIHGDFWQYPTSMACDSSNNYYIVGHFDGDADFDPGPLTTTLSPNGYDGFLLKLSKSGDFEWVNHLAGTGEQTIASVTVTPDQRIYTTGLYAGVVDFDPGINIFEMTSELSINIFIQEVNTNGDFISAHSIEGNSSKWVEQILSDSSGNLLLIGRFSDTCDFDLDSGDENVISEMGFDSFVVKYNNCGPLANLNVSQKTGMIVYPNPSDGDLTISVESDNKIHVIIYNVMGLTVFDETLAGSLNYHLSVNPSVGTYIIEVHNEKEVYREKFRVF